MNENEFTITAKVVAEEFYDCSCCVFFKEKSCVKLQKDGLIPPCDAKHRKDGKAVMFSIKSFKVNKRKTK